MLYIGTLTLARMNKNAFSAIAAEVMPRPKLREKGCVVWNDKNINVNIV